LPATAGRIDDRLAADALACAALLARRTTLKSPHGDASLALPDRLDQNEKPMAAQLNALCAVNAAR
jgi:hypothetical protein